MNKKFSLYIHIPFCVKKCHYCDFTSFAQKEEQFESYFNALNREVEMRSKTVSKPIDTIYIGGGTPSYVPVHYISDLLERIRSHYVLRDDCEISMEMNPGTVDQSSCNAYYSYGINRISVGVQSANDRLLHSLGRIHNFDDAKKTVGYLKNAGFENINIDIMFGLPDQTLDDWMTTLKEVCKLDPEHISVYSLTLEENTPFYNWYFNTDYLPDALDRQMYHSAVKYLKSLGYEQYEISNFAKEGKICKHNYYCWRMEDYLGLGVNAHSYIEGSRYQNGEELDLYIDTIIQGKNAIVISRDLDDKEKMGDYIFLGLRTIEGINLTDFKENFNNDLMLIYHNEICELIEQNLLKLKTENLSLTKKGLDYANYVMREFV